MVGLPDGEKNFEDMYNRLHTIPACDGQTSCHGIVRATYASRGNKPWKKLSNSQFVHDGAETAEAAGRSIRYRISRVAADQHGDSTVRRLIYDVRQINIQPASCFLLDRALSRGRPNGRQVGARLTATVGRLSVSTTAY